LKERTMNQILNTIMQRKRELSILALLFAILVIPASTRVRLSAAAALGSGVELANFDKTVRPQDDFYRYVNGVWLKQTVIPPDRSNYGAFTALEEKAEQALRAIIEETASRKNSPGSEAQKIGDLYLSFMDETKVEAEGMRPIAADLARIDRISDTNDLVSIMAEFQRGGIGSLVRILISPDARKSDTYAVYLSQAGISLPDRDYYLSDDPKFEKIRGEYVAHIEKMFTLAGIPDAKTAAAAVFALEKRLAEAHWTRVESRDREKTYNKRTLEVLQQESPNFPFNRYFEGLGARNVPYVIVRQPSYLTAMGKALADTPLQTWKHWLKWNVITGTAPYLSKQFVDEDFAFFGRTLRGMTENRARWKRGVDLVENALGEAVGKIYVERHFPPEAKARMEALVENLIEAYRQGIQSLDWMGEETKKQALAKLEKFTPKIGYPDKWRDYSKLDIKPGDLVGNVRRAVAFEMDRDLAKLGKPVDRDEWSMTPQTVNAYYNASMNQIVFPAAILQPPFFNLAADDAVNYGAIGAVIGHEIGHGFDDQGSKYDGDGNMRNWWTDRDRTEFEKRAKMLIDQYSEYEPLPGHRLNGALTVGENIGDLGGVTIAYRAYKIALNGREAPVIDGLTGDQRFFIGWAQIWPRLYRDEELLNRLKTDPHSPSEYRCNGVVANLPEFYEAFQVKEGDRLYRPPDKRVKIW